MRVFQDKEIRWFYGIVISPGILAVLLTANQYEWSISVVMGVIIFGFLFIGWPSSASLHENGNITFRIPLRSTTITPENLNSVKVIGTHGYGAHIVLRTTRDLPIGYRCQKYENAPALAQAVLDLIKESPNAKVTEDALKLLRQTASGSRKPLPLK